MPDTDPVELTAQLVKCPSVTPADAGALDILHDLLGGAGFECAWADRRGSVTCLPAGARKVTPVASALMAIPTWYLSATNKIGRWHLSEPRSKTE